MKMTVHCELPAPPDRVWRALQSPAMLAHVAAPLLIFVPIDPPALPKTWRPARYWVAMRFFGLIPLGRQWIVPSFHQDPEQPGHYRLRDDGHGSLARRWDHWIILAPAEDGGTVYTDQVEVDAGPLTPFIWLFAQIFYRHRQRRLKRFFTPRSR